MSTSDRVKPIGMSVRRHHGFHTMTPFLVVKGAAEAMKFYKNAFGATEVFPPLVEPRSGRIVHVELRIGDSPLMLSDEFPQWNQHAPGPEGAVLLHLYVEDVDAVFRQAIAAGATESIPVSNQFYGARGGRLTDPFGQRWVIETYQEEVSPEAIRERFGKFLANSPG